jgi:hypothetical protein
MGIIVVNWVSGFKLFVFENFPILNLHFLAQDVQVVIAKVVQSSGENQRLKRTLYSGSDVRACPILAIRVRQVSDTLSIRIPD